MNPSIKLLLAGCLLLAATGVSNAGANNHDVVRDSNGNIVHSTSGDCVHTQWMNDYDACAQESAPVAPAVVKETSAVYFGFNKATLTTAAKQRLDVLAADLKLRGVMVKDVRIAGFADRIGSAVYNEKLSKKRADAVRNYLVSKGVASAHVIETRWFGESLPTTDCPKKGVDRKKMIECLEKDRRVEVEVDVAAPTAP